MSAILPSVVYGFRNQVCPEVTLVIPTLNEEKSIQRCIASLLEQTYDRIGEILVVDGGSGDRTREIVSGFGGRVRLLDNPRVTAASAMNIALAEVKTPIVVRIDAHTEYSGNYVERSVDALLSSGATIVGGPMRPRGTTKFGMAVALVTGSPLAVGPGKFHYARTSGPVDTVYLGTFFVEDVLAVGGFDDQNLQWAAEDQELNYRIRKAGGVVYLDPSIESWYEPRSTVRALARQYRNYGLAKASTLKKHRRLPSWRPLAPAGLLGLTATGLVVGVALGSTTMMVAIPGVHLLLVIAGSTIVARKDPSLITRSVLAVLVCHWSYAVGFFQGLGRVMLGRSFEIQPKGRRRV